MNDFVPTFWNTLTQFNVGSRTSRISGGQVAYKKRGYAWDRVSSDVRSDLSVSSFPGDVQFPKNAQDWVDIHFNSEYSAKRQVTKGTWHNAEDEFVMRLRADCPTNSVGIIDGAKPWQVKYLNAFDQGVHLIYGIWKAKTARFEHVIEVTEMPPGDSEYLEYDFYIQSNDATTFVGENHDRRPWAGNTGDAASVEGFSIFLAKGGDSSTSRGAVLRAPVCWWTQLDGTLVKKNVRVDFEIQSDGITVKATKYVKRSDIQEALSQGSVYRADVTFNPDPDPESSSVDGDVERFSAESWSSLRTGSGTSHNDNSNSQMRIIISNDGSGNPWQLVRSIVTFDTSSIGSGQQVDSASLEVTYGIQSNGAGYGTNFAVALVAATPASVTDLVDADYSQLGSTELATGRHAYGTTGARTFTLNASGKANIDVEGDAKFGLREGYYDLDGNTPSGPTGEQTRYNPRTAEHGDAPELSVTHSAAASGSPHYYYQNNQHAN